jgi:hypothetical protein
VSSTLAGDNTLIHLDFNMKKIILYWLPLMVIGFCNGIFRGLVLAHFFSDLHARQISSLLLIVWVALYTFFIFERLEIKAAQRAWFTGAVWLVATVTFEFFLGLVVVGSTFTSLLTEYNLLEGRLWSLVLIAIGIMPWMVFKYHRQQR